MSLQVNLTQAEEARLTHAAMQIGIAPEELLHRILNEHLPEMNTVADIDRILRERQEQDGTTFASYGSASELFSAGKRKLPK